MKVKIRPVLIKGQHCKIINGRKVQSVKGRPSGTGKFAELTVRRRIPLSLLPVVDALLEKQERIVLLRNELKSLED